MQTPSSSPQYASRARFADENAKGGVNGRKFTYVDPTLYKQGDTAGALAEAQRLVQQEGVAAIVPALTSVPPMQFLTQQKTSLFGWNISPLSWDTQYAFGITGSLVAPFPKSAPGSLSLPNMLTKQLKDGRTISVEDKFDPVSGIPRMGALPVRITRPVTHTAQATPERDSETRNFGVNA